MNNLNDYYEKSLLIEKPKVLYAWIGSIGLLFYTIFIWTPFLLLESLPATIFFPPALILSILSIAPYFIIWRKYKRKYREAGNLSKLDKLPEKFADIINQRIKFLSQRMSPKHQKLLNETSIEFLYEKRNFTALPSMIYTSGVIKLIIPLGYFKALKTDTEAADSILAHELAHFFHHDSNLSLKIRCYYQLSEFWNSNSVTILIIVGSLHWTLLFNGTYFSGFEFTLFFIMLLAFLQDFIIRKKFHDSHLNYIHKRVLETEKLADLYAMTLTSPSALKRFLKSNLSYDSVWYSLHPSLSERLYEIDKCDKSLQNQI